ncbi:class I SAM-dependent methyltransferase [Fulvivirgaceae bacterium LMO-SS25]
MKIACYTAIFGNWDGLLTPIYGDRLIKEADFFCFTDNPLLQSDFFKIILVDRKFADTTRENRYYKLLPHLILPNEYDFTLYIDGNIILKSKSLIGDFEQIFNEDTKQIAMLSHPYRNCLYDEGIACIESKKDKVEIINSQLASYRKEGYPANNGLVAGTIIFRKSSMEVKMLGEAWWDQLRNGSKRDQLSFNYVVWKTNFQGLSILPWKWEENHFYRKVNHQKPSFSNTFFMRNTEKDSGYVPSRIKEPVAWVGHIPFAFYLVDKLKPTTIVELGSHTGNSFFAFCQAVKRIDLDANVYAIDLWTGDRHAGFYENEIYEDVLSYTNIHYPKIGQLIRKDFNEAVDEFENESIDCLHIDGLHTYEAVKNDFETWLPKLKRDGVILFHDTNVFRNDFGVHQYWSEIIKTYPNSFNFTHSHGLGVLAINSDSISKSGQLLSELKENHFLINSLIGYGNHLFEMLPFYFELEKVEKKYTKLKNSKPIVYRNKIKRFLKGLNFGKK